MNLLHVKERKNNMAGQKMIQPIKFVSNNQCPKCYGHLELLEVDIYVAAIDKKGRPIGGSEFTEASLRCKTCGEEYPAWKKGACYYIAPTTPPIKPVMKEFNPFYTN